MVCVCVCGWLIIFLLFFLKLFSFFIISFVFWNKRNEVLNHKGKLDEYRAIASPVPSKWAFDPDTIFERLNLYLVRLHDVYDIIKAANDFFKLEKIEMGSTKGRYLGEKMSTVTNEFQIVYNTCIANNSNLLDPSNNKFQHLKTYFHTQIAILERKLSQIFTEAFKSSNSIETSIKLVEMIGELLYRPIIKEQLNHEIEMIIDYLNELNMVDDLLNSDWDSEKNMVSECCDLPSFSIFFSSLLYAFTKFHSILFCRNCHLFDCTFCQQQISCIGCECLSNDCSRRVKSFSSSDRRTYGKRQ